MSFRLKYAGDKDISVGKAGGISIGAPEVGGSSNPPYGTVLSTAYGVDYDIGAEAYSSFLAIFVKTQICNVDTKADGSGGSFIDWANAYSVSFKPYGSVVGFNTAPYPDVPVEVPSGSYSFFNCGEYLDGSQEIHNGGGGLDIIGAGTFTYFPSGSYTGASNNVDDTVGVPVYTGSAYGIGTGASYPYLWNGSGGYYESVTGTSYGTLYSSGTEVDVSLRYNGGNYQTEVPTGSGNFYDNGKYELYSYFWDGSGYYYTGTTGESGGSFEGDTTNIWYDDINFIQYRWDGYGGYTYFTFP